MLSSGKQIHKSYVIAHFVQKSRALQLAETAVGRIN